MRRALFGSMCSDRPAKGEPKAARARLRVTLRVGNEYEGKRFDYVHDADTLSTLLAESRQPRPHGKNTGSSSWFQSSRSSFRAAD